ncbi:hypothetical protein [Gemmata sp.]
MQGVLVRDRTGLHVVCVVTERATRYYRVVTRAEWVPALVGEVI